MRADRRADVAPVKDRARFLRGEASLKVDQGRAHLGYGGDDAGGHAGFGRPQVGAGQVGGAKRKRGRDRIAPHRAHGAVQQPGVEMGKAVMRGQGARDGALARGGGAVDGDGEGHVASPAAWPLHAMRRRRGEPASDHRGLGHRAPVQHPLQRQG